MGSSSGSLAHVVGGGIVRVNSATLPTGCDIECHKRLWLHWTPIGVQMRWSMAQSKKNFVL
jgi:hypothetical protein